MKKITTLKRFSLVGCSLFLIFIASSCGKYAGDVDSNYIGTWYSDTLTSLSTGELEFQYIIIDGKKNSEFGYRCVVSCPECDCYITEKGNAKINKKRSKLYIGTTNSTTPLSIEEEPSEINGNWQMKIEGWYYYKQ